MNLDSRMEQATAKLEELRRMQDEPGAQAVDMATLASLRQATAMTDEQARSRPFLDALMYSLRSHLTMHPCLDQLGGSGIPLPR